MRNVWSLDSNFKKVIKYITGTIWGNFKMDYVLHNNTVSMLKLLNVIIVLW